jgi:NAD(P)-dependent dehydrogenase (short-subunit alcohol dehydrogenase family)
VDRYVDAVSIRLGEKVAIITGAASGFGRATAIMFGAEGASLVLVDLNEGGLKDTVEELRGVGCRAEFVVGDVSMGQTAAEAVARATSSFGKLDVLVNNAGISQGRSEDTWNVPDEEWDTIMGTNLRSVFVFGKAAIPALLEAGAGSIVNVSSIAATVATGGSTYGAAKGGIASYTRHVAVELAARGVRVNCVAPGLMRTPMSTGERRGLPLEVQEERIASLGQLAPMKRTGSVEDIAYAIVYLASDESRYVTGHELVVDGGYVIRNSVTTPPGDSRG